MIISKLRKQNKLNRMFPSFLQTSANVRKLMTAGNAMPTVDRQKAPISEIKCSKFGMAMAKKTIKKHRMVSHDKFQDRN